MFLGPCKRPTAVARFCRRRHACCCSVLHVLCKYSVSRPAVSFDIDSSGYDHRCSSGNDPVEKRIPKHDDMWVTFKEMTGISKETIDNYSGKFVYLKKEPRSHPNSDANGDGGRPFGVTLPSFLINREKKLPNNARMPSRFHGPGGTPIVHLEDDKRFGASLSDKDFTLSSCITIDINDLHGAERALYSPGEPRRGVFGLKYLSETLKSVQDDCVISERGVIITLDDILVAMAFNQKLSIPAISIPSCMEYKVPLNALSLLKCFKKVYFIKPIRGAHNNIDNIVSQLGGTRCHLVSLNDVNVAIEKDPFSSYLDALKSIDDNCEERVLKKILDNGRPISSTNISTISRYVKAIREELENPSKFNGVPSQWLPTLTSVQKGLRAGEFTILSGPTGSGKTSVLAQISLDYCMQGVPTLWGSFEIPNHRILKKMLHQFHGKSFLEEENALEEGGPFDRSVEKFSLLPMYFMNFFGSCPLKDVIETMKTGVEANGIKHIILDNLQFMTSGQERSSLDKWDLSDRVISELRRFASEKDCHVTLVVHPRKELDNSVLGVCSISGTSKATQEADNIIILQKVGRQRFLDVRKNRYDGQLGRIIYDYDPSSQKIFEVVASEKRPSQNPSISNRRGEENY